ncbi:MAG: ATP-binding protein [Anaerolineae bacterium]
MTAAGSQPRFISVRWRLIAPLFVVVLLVGMVGAYAIGNNLSANATPPQTNLLLQTSDAIRTHTAQMYEQTRMEAQRIAFTQGVANAIQARSADDLEPILQSMARLADLESVIVTDAQGVELVGLLRIQQAEGSAYSISTDTDFHLQPIVQAVFNEGYIGATNLLRTPEGLLLYTAVPVNVDNKLVGLVMIGQEAGHVLTQLKAEGFAELSLYGDDGSVLQSTFPAEAGATLSSLNLAPESFQHVLSLTDSAALSSLTLDGRAFQAAYFPFQFGPQTLGVISAVAPDSVPAIAQSNRQLTALVFAAIAGTVIVALFLGVNKLVVNRAAHISNVATALATGNSTLRTGLIATDEVGAIGQALDLYADSVQERQDALRTSLRRQRREAEFLLSVLETMPDGIVVQDQDGIPVVINEQARSLLGTQIETPLFPDLASVMNGKLGRSMAPGLYALGDPARLERDGRLLTAQAAALMNLLDQRVGTVIVIRDITYDVRREQLQNKLMQRIADEVQLPLSSLAHATKTPPLADVARSLSLHAAALQKLIVEMREITMPDAPNSHEPQRPLYLDTFIWSIANEWRQVASAANLTLDILIEKRGLFVLGDERRLRWAVGNIVDNAIKYTLPGGKLTVEINGESGNRALMRVRDNGVGITPDDLPHLFTPYFRGTPRTATGELLHVPGMGQGLSVAKQIIESHAGLIQIKSKPGVGTATYFALPLTAPVGYELPLLPGEADLEGETVRIASQRRQ